MLAERENHSSEGVSEDMAAETRSRDVLGDAGELREAGCPLAEELDYTVRLPVPWSNDELATFQEYAWRQKRTWNWLRSNGEPFCEWLNIFNPAELQKALVISPLDGERQIVAREIYRGEELYATAQKESEADECTLAVAIRARKWLASIGY